MRRGRGKLVSTLSATLSRPVLFHYIAAPEDLRDMARNLFRMIETGALKVSIPVSGRVLACDRLRRNDLRWLL